MSCAKSRLIKLTKYLTSQWPFAMWGVDTIDMINQVSNWHCFIFYAIDYFTEQVEATSFSNFTKIHIKHHVKKNIFADSGHYNWYTKSLNNNLIETLCNHFKLLITIRSLHRKNQWYSRGQKQKCQENFTKKWINITEIDMRSCYSISMHTTFLLEPLKEWLPIL